MGAYRALLAKLAAVRPALTAVLEHAVPLELSSTRVRLLFESPDGRSFLATQASEPDALAVLKEVARAQLGGTPVVEIETGQKPAGHSGATVAAIDAEARKTASDRARRAVEAHPVVAAAVKIFGAEIREVRLPESQE
jgi:hypothetical protein